LLINSHRNMHTEKNFIDYGIYIDRKQAYIISFNHNSHEELIEEHAEENHGELPRSTKVQGQETHLQNEKNEQLKKFCKTIMQKIVSAHSIVIFGPSESKFELQKEIRESKSLKHIIEELLVTDVLDKNAALRYAKEHFALPAKA
jgi:hypothetical protein